MSTPQVRRMKEQLLKNGSVNTTIKRGNGDSVSYKKQVLESIKSDGSVVDYLKKDKLILLETKENGVLKLSKSVKGDKWRLV